MSPVLSIARQDASETIEFSAGGNFLFKHFQVKAGKYLI